MLSPRRQVAVTFFTLFLLSLYSFITSAGARGWAGTFKQMGSIDAIRRALSFGGACCSHPPLSLSAGKPPTAPGFSGHGFVTRLREDIHSPVI